ncbi:DNA gyrase inhibitor YacG [Gimibacter soli]|uniref:DNA gyrase inhibitor YacG n=1 Tax=Gimibacter soli TaxID=3024400 RepID=A0AAF0BI24_9PROT|nr:DNA gyrase inhibitor YacG [Gimibacter soli]WCL54853.1 DNA gyrase inhibitor YacG [Gimibacter soli]
MADGKCPECGKATVDTYKPFCSKRCADLDLGKWFNEDYVLPASQDIDQGMEDDGEDSEPTRH